METHGNAYIPQEFVEPGAVDKQLREMFGQDAFRQDARAEEIGDIALSALDKEEIAAFVAGLDHSDEAMTEDEMRGYFADLDGDGQNEGLNARLEKHGYNAIDNDAEKRSKWLDDAAAYDVFRRQQDELTQEESDDDDSKKKKKHRDGAVVPIAAAHHSSKRKRVWAGDPRSTSGRLIGKSSREAA